MKNIVIGILVLFFGFLAVLMITDGIVGIQALFYEPVFLYFIISTILLIIVSGSYKELYRGILIALDNNTRDEAENYVIYEAAYEFLMRGTVIIVLIGMIIAGVRLLGNLANPDAIGPLLAIILLAILYGSIQLLVLNLVKYRIHIISIKE